MKHIAIITGTRADWGLLSPLAATLRQDPRACLSIIATNMHLMPQYGLTVNEILAEGHTVAARVEMEADATPEGCAVAMGACLSGMGRALAALRPDVAVILGDRFEALAAACAALTLGIPVAHIAGGETTLGAIDDPMRHCITHIAEWHFTETEPYRRKVVELGADPAKAFNVGALGVWNALHTSLMSRSELSESVGLQFDKPTLLVTFHAATACSGSPAAQFAELLAALDTFRASHSADVLITYPNNDPGGRELIPMLEQWASANAGRGVVAIPSLGKRRYLSALRQVCAVAGNSSSGIIEVPSMGIPTIDIGTRQRGRISASTVLHCAPQRDEITAALRHALKPSFAEMCRSARNPYAQPDTPGRIASLLLAALGD